MSELLQWITLKTFSYYDSNASISLDVNLATGVSKDQNNINNIPPRIQFVFKDSKLGNSDTSKIDLTQREISSLRQFLIKTKTEETTQTFIYKNYPNHLVKKLELTKIKDGSILVILDDPSVVGSDRIGVKISSSASIYDFQDSLYNDITNNFTEKSLMMMNIASLNYLSSLMDRQDNKLDKMISIQSEQLQSNISHYNIPEQNSQVREKKASPTKNVEAIDRTIITTNIVQKGNNYYVPFVKNVLASDILNMKTMLDRLSLLGEYSSVGEIDYFSDLINRAYPNPSVADSIKEDFYKRGDIYTAEYYFLMLMKTYTRLYIQERISRSVPLYRFENPITLSDKSFGFVLDILCSHLILDSVFTTYLSNVSSPENTRDKESLWNYITPDLMNKSKLLISPLLTSIYYEGQEEEFISAVIENISKFVSLGYVDNIKEKYKLETGADIQFNPDGIRTQMEKLLYILNNSRKTLYDKNSIYDKFISGSYDFDRAGSIESPSKLHTSFIRNLYRQSGNKSNAVVAIKEIFDGRGIVADFINDEIVIEPDLLNSQSVPHWFVLLREDPHFDIHNLDNVNVLIDKYYVNDAVDEYGINDVVGQNNVSSEEKDAADMMI